jgi:thiamine-phosphate pyrophosphorylase
MNEGRWILLLYAITNRRQWAGTEDERIGRLADLAGNWSAHNIDFVQVREKDLSAESLIGLASEIVHAVKQAGDRTKVLINWDPGDPKTAAMVARAAGAVGAHLRSGLDEEQLTAAIREVRDGLGASAPISVSCHTSADVTSARHAGATLSLFGPVFEKVLAGEELTPGSGVEALAAACRAGLEAGQKAPLSVLALGGITFANAWQCVAAGAAGIAAIRLFQDRGGERERKWHELAQG